MQATLKTLALLLLTALAFCGFGGEALAQRPAITGFSPASGIVGSTVTINGTNFNRDVNGAVWTGAIPYRVRFAIGGGVANVTPTFISATQLRAVVPAGAQTAPISLVQGFTLMSTSATSFTVIYRPTISSFTPATGPVGTTVNIAGSSFNRDVNGAVWTGAIPWRVRFATTTGTTDVVPTYVSASSVQAVVPNGAITGTLRLVQGATVMSTSTTSFTVTVVQTRLRITNNTQYDMVSLTLNGVQQFASGTGVLIGGTNDFLVAPGNYTLVAGIGFVAANGARDVWFTFTRSVTIANGATVQQTFAPITLGSLLTAGSASRRWNGSYFNANGGLGVASYIFQASGAFTMQDNGVNIGSGTAVLVSWPNRSNTVTFRTSANGPLATLDISLGKFFQQVGPPSWPIIEFIRQ
jgi:IPT/TIG domain